MITFVLSLCGNIVQAKEFSIKDVQNTDEAYDKIQWTLNQGYMGLTLSKFLPNSYVKRNEFALILAKINGDIKNLANPSTPSFTDVSKNDQYFRYIESEKNYITLFKGPKGNLFKPTAYLTREDACMSIVKVLGYDNEDAVAENVDSDVSLSEIIQDDDKISPALMKYVTLAVQNELIDLREDGDNSYVDPKKSITRRQLAVLIYNAYQQRDLNKNDGSDEAFVPGNSTSTESNSTTNTTAKAPDKSAGNTTDSSKQASKDSQAQTKPAEDDNGYFKIDINGVQNNYVPLLPMDFDGNVWTVYLKSDMNSLSSKNSFLIQLPKNVSDGFVYSFENNMSTYDDLNFYGPKVRYSNKSDTPYFFDIPNGFTSKITLKIDSWGGRGGYATGTMEAQINLDNNETIYFKNGVFKIKIQPSSF